MPGFYTTDLTTIFTGDASDTISETTINGWTNAGSLNNADPDIFLQGTAAHSALSGTNKTGGCTILYQHGSSITSNSSEVIAVWAVWPVPSGIDTFTGNGIVGFAGNGTSSTQLKSWKLSGGDVDPIGGWQQYIFSLSRASTAGISNITPEPLTYTYFGIGYNQTATFSKAQLFAIDSTRYGRMTLSATSGNSTSISNADPLSSSAANFPQMAYYDEWNEGTNPTLNSTSIGASIDGGYHKLGHIQYNNGIYVAKGIISLGTSSTSVYFNDANRTINFKDEFLSFNDFNRLEIRNASSTIILDACSFNFVPRNSLITSTYAPATPRGNLQLFDNALVQLYGCSFVDMGTFTFTTGATNSILDSCIFRRCGAVYPATGSTAGIPMSNCNFINGSNASGMLFLESQNNISNMANCTFSTNSDSTVGISISGALSTDSQNPTQFIFNGHTFSGFTGSTGNRWAVDFTGTGFLEIVPTNGCNITQSQVTASGTGTVTVASTPVSFEVTNVVYNSEVRIFKASDGTEIGGVENIGVTSPDSGTVSGPDSTGRYTLTVNHTLNEAVNVVVINISDLSNPAKSYQPYFYTYTLSSTGNQNLLVSQVLDRQYANP
jgi:hypothetical protein